jgi:hypothetical protein
MERHAERAGADVHLVDGPALPGRDVVHQLAAGGVLEGRRLAGDERGDGEHRRPAVDDAEVQRVGGFVEEEHHPPAGLAPSLHGRREPAGPARLDPPAARLPPGEELLERDRMRGDGERPVREALEDDRAVGELAHLLHHVAGRGPGPQAVECPVHALFDPQGGEALVEDVAVHGLGDRHERHLPLEGDEGEAAALGCLHEDPGHLRVPADQLDAQCAHTGRRQVLDVALQASVVVGKGDARRQQELAAAEQRGDVGHLGDVHPANR